MTIFVNSIMVQYYRTTKGLYYKIYRNGTKIRISKDEYLSKVTTKKQISKHRSRSKSRRTSRKKSRSISRKKGKRECRTHLSEKIAENIEEYNMGKYSSRKQAIAVSYSQLKKMYPECRKFYKQ